MKYLGLFLLLVTSNIALSEAYLGIRKTNTFFRHGINAPVHADLNMGYFNPFKMTAMDLKLGVQIQRSDYMATTVGYSNTGMFKAHTGSGSTKLNFHGPSLDFIIMPYSDFYGIYSYSYKVGRHKKYSEDKLFRESFLRGQEHRLMGGYKLSSRTHLLLGATLQSVTFDTDVVREIGTQEEFLEDTEKTRKRSIAYLMGLRLTNL